LEAEGTFGDRTDVRDQRRDHIAADRIERSAQRDADAVGKPLGRLDVTNEDEVREGVLQMLEDHGDEYGEGKMTRDHVFDCMRKNYDIWKPRGSGIHKERKVGEAYRALGTERDALRGAGTLDSSPLRWLHTANLKYGRGAMREATEARVEAQAGLKDAVKRAKTQGAWDRLKIKAGRLLGFDLDARKPLTRKSSQTGNPKKSDEGGSLGCRTEAHAVDELRGVTVGEVLDNKGFLRQWLSAADLDELCKILDDFDLEDMFFEVVTGWGSPAGDVYMAANKSIAQKCAASSRFQGLSEFLDCLFILHIKLALLMSGSDYGRTDGSRPAWKTIFGRPTPSTRRRPRNCRHLLDGVEILRHRRDVVPVTAAARWRGGSRRSPQ
jgi:hypothetical protein